ncbi:MAG: bifunctional 5,6,7,8-tetrahydromethanopterin hydro-lyase/3-hexulose-6-phosphate synthase [Methanophagales archaeon]|nr:bifunctional 5,6,7,8-tetrahydromethanopterin hydro-lyase/3-hexulose-6-phosphate synthase [Methanophagales archaeon]
MQVGEALVGEGAEVAHIDLLVGEKNGPVGTAFTNAMSQMSAGHTPIFAVIRPNLPVKPSTLIVPKVTVRNMKEAERIFGPAQSAVAKAVADSVEEGVIPEEKAEELVVIVSVFLHPQAADYNKIYRFNYGAAKLAVKRAMTGFPDIKKVLYEKDRSRHPALGLKVTKLWDPPYLQVALDIPSWKQMERVVSELPQNDHLIIEAGTPLIKRYGVEIVGRIKEIKPETFVVADLKTLDTGNLEARMVSDAGADAVVISGLAPLQTIEKAVAEARKTGIYACLDMLNVASPLELLEKLSSGEEGASGGSISGGSISGGSIPDVVELHRAIDVEREERHAWGNIAELKRIGRGSSSGSSGGKMLVAVAGGIREENAAEALKGGADILIVGRGITNSRDVEAVARRFLRLMKEEIDQYRVMTDF